MIINDVKELHIQYDEPLRLLRIEWAGGHDMRRLRPALEHLHKLVHNLQVTHALLALNNLPDISAYDQIWLGSQWLPKAERLSLKQAVVVLESKQVYNQQAIETLMIFGRSKPVFDFQFFRHSPTALHWLTNDSPRLPMLLDEWDAAFGLAGPPQSAVAEPRAHYGRAY